MISVDTMLAEAHDLGKLEELCRLCGRYQQSNTAILDETHRYNYLKIINIHFKDEIQLSKTDVLPLKLCVKCLKSLMTWHDFYHDCLKVDKKYKKLIDKFNLNDPEKKNTSVGNEVEVIEVSVDSDNFDFFNENEESSDDFDISNVNIKESATLASANEFPLFDDLDDSNDSISGAENKATDKPNDHSEIVIEISGKIDETSLENIKMEDGDFLSPEEIKIEYIEPTDEPCEMETKPEQQETIELNSSSGSESVSIVPKPKLPNSTESLPNNSSDMQPSKSTELLCEEVKFVPVEVKPIDPFKVFSEPRRKNKRTPRRASRICHLCGKHYNTESGFRHHLIMHEAPSYSCHECGHVFYEAQNLKKHLAAIHSDERPFQCHLCGSKYKRKDVLQEHIKRVHDGIKRVWNMDNLKKYRTKQQSQKKYKYNCPHCDKVLGTKGYLNDHINGVHTQEKLYKCNECEMSFTRKTTFKYHFKRAHILKKNVLEPRGTFLKDCEYCGLQFQIKKYYEQHIASKHLHTFKCPYCEEIFDNKFQLTKHIDTSHADKIFRCESCGKGFAEELLLKRHIYICHSDRKPYECHECGYKANKKATLAVHIRRHTGEKPYQCDLCSRRFTQSVDFRKHRANHFNKKL